jgi:hypothetical protein
MQKGVFDYAYDPASWDIPVTHEYDIAAGTVVTKGQVVILSNALVVPGGAVAATYLMLGIAAEDHLGVANTLNPRSIGTRIKVWDNPTAVFKCRPNTVITNTGASATTFTDATTLSAIGASKFVGGYVKIKTGSAVPQGKVYRLTASATGGVLTGAFTEGLVTGDTALLFPPVLGNDWNLTPTYDNLNLNSTGATALQVVDYDTAQEWVYFKIRQHQKAVSAT